MVSEEEANTEPPWSSGAGLAGPALALGVTVLYHPDLSRVGETAVLVDCGAPQHVVLGRTSPTFRATSGAATQPLLVAQLSDREPLHIASLPGGGVRIEHSGERMLVSLGGEPLRGARELSQAQLERGVVFVIGRAVALLLHAMEVALEPQPDLGLFGESRALRALRADILRAADREVPVLLRGETGVGKELVAAAIHATSTRREGPYVPINMAAIPESMAEAELFGFARGAFTGATQERIGHFALADGGTLFLDEIGEASTEVQVKLLRITEHKELQPLGGRTRKVDVRLIAATDSDLERSMAAGSFRRPLLERISGYVLRVPSLRERVDDIPRLFLRFLRAELTLQGEQQRLDAPANGVRPWLPLSFMLRLVAHDFPGNVRELRNAAQQLAIANRGAQSFRVPDSLGHLHAPERDARSAAPSELGETLPPSPLSSSPAPRVAAASEPTRKKARALRDEDLVVALERNAFNITKTAAELGISRTTLHTRMGACPSLRNASDLTDEEIAVALAEAGGDVEGAAARLRVSDRALALRRGPKGR